MLAFAVTPTPAAADLSGARPRRRAVVYGQKVVLVHDASGNAAAVVPAGSGDGAVDSAAERAGSRSRFHVVLQPVSCAPAAVLHVQPELAFVVLPALK